MSSSSGWALGFSALAIAIAVAAYFHEPAPPAASAKPAVPPPAKPAADPAVVAALDQRLQEAQRQIDGLYETVARLEKKSAEKSAEPQADAAPAATAPPGRPAADPARPARPGGAFAGGDITAALKDQVGLDDDKAAKVKAILDESRTSMRALARNQQGGGGMEKFRELRQQTDDKVAAILTPEEMEKFKKVRGQFIGGMRQRGGGGAGGAAAAPTPAPAPAAPGANPL